MLKRALILSAAVLMLSSIMACANTIYDVRHKFNLQPGGNLPPASTWFHQEKASAFQDPPGKTINTINPPACAAMGPAGGTMGPSTAVAPIGGQTGTGNSQVWWNPIIPGSLVGRHRVWGSAITTPSKGYMAWAWSGSSVVAQAGQKDAKGKVTWGRFLQDTITGSVGIANWGRGKDPISVQTYDMVTGEILSEEILLSIDFEVLGNGSLVWGSEDDSQPDHFEMHGNQGKLSVVCQSQYVPESQRGSLYLEIQNGVFVSASASGIFAGFNLPTVGSAGDFTAENWSNEITLDYDMPTLPEGDTTAYQILLGGEGEGYDAGAMIPEPSSFLTLGSGLLAFGAIAIRRRWR